MLAYRQHGEKVRIIMANWFTMPLNIMTEEHQEMIAASYDVAVSELEERKYSIKLETTELSEEEIIYLGDNGDIVICNDCGAVIATLTNSYAVIYGDDGEISHEVCLGCLNNARYDQCEETGHYFNRRNLITLNPDTSREMIVFSGCERAEEAYICDDCGERFDRISKVSLFFTEIINNTQTTELYKALKIQL